MWLLWLLRSKALCKTTTKSAVPSWTYLFLFFALLAELAQPAKHDVARSRLLLVHEVGSLVLILFRHLLLIVLGLL